MWQPRCRCGAVAGGNAWRGECLQRTSCKWSRASKLVVPRRAWECISLVCSRNFHPFSNSIDSMEALSRPGDWCLWHSSLYEPAPAGSAWLLSHMIGLFSTPRASDLVTAWPSDLHHVQFRWCNLVVSDITHCMWSTVREHISILNTRHCKGILKVFALLQIKHGAWNSSTNQHNWMGSNCEKPMLYNSMHAIAWCKWH